MYLPLRILFHFIHYPNVTHFSKFNIFTSCIDLQCREDLPHYLCRPVTMASYFYINLLYDFLVALPIPAPSIPGEKVVTVIVIVVVVVSIFLC